MSPGLPGSTPELRVQLPRPTPIFLTYITAQVRDGKLSYLGRHLRLGSQAAAVRVQLSATFHEEDDSMAPLERRRFCVPSQDKRKPARARGPDRHFFRLG